MVRIQLTPAIWYNVQDAMLLSDIQYENLELIVSVEYKCTIEWSDPYSEKFSENGDDYIIFESEEDLTRFLLVFG